ncbi:fungal-specific transcription factor domain-domain-containing protein [Coniella lustricola]|uniref:Fungal-specific transcription factor domain-domain-containing protein n=1 Tax=Coniella lustricola TaxID=2025994 RepID=A0A2T3AJ24_9PEZI|nr:fungal-specific transcription factor domain-domain-containing protein [Coniella lustricola]
MPRPKRPGAPEPKKRSRNGCWNCKARKVKCDETRPKCENCQRTGEACDYSIRLNWEGRKKKNPGFETILGHSPSESSASSLPPPRRPSDARSNSSRATEDHRSPLSATTPQTADDVTIPRSEPQATPPIQPSSRPVVFSGHLSINKLENGGQASLSSPDLASPIFSLPRPPNNSITRVCIDSNQAGAARQRPSKRLRYSVDLDAPRQSPQASPHVTASTNPSAAASSPGLFATNPTSASVGSLDSPLTPAASSPYSEDGSMRATGFRQMALSSPDAHRMSVSSLLSGPPGPAGPIHYAPPSQRTVNAKKNLCLSDVAMYYGLDPGFPDLDLGPNDDVHGILDLQMGIIQSECDLKACTGEHSPSVSDGKKNHDTRTGLYKQPLQVRIPRDLEPLPAKLLGNPMNLLYFHHFMNYTAKALVPHDDEQSNPYRHVLPQMAVKNDKLLSLMLAYAASHRAHLLGHPEPATRIAHWVQDIFPALRNALSDPGQSISNENIATGIMLASLEIVSPTAFGVAIPWQRHLGLARELISSRKDGIRWTREWKEEDQVRAFLWSWLAYLDVLGSLSGGRHESSTRWILDYQQDEFEEEWDEIDCIMGITTRGVYLLAQVAELAKECDTSRADNTGDPSGPWEPPKDLLQRAWVLEDKTLDSISRAPQPCKHLHASGRVAHWEGREISAMSEAYHWAGLVHLYRRVLERASLHADIQHAVLKIYSCLNIVPLGGKAEASMLFPLFTAACETTDKEQRDRVRERMDSMRRSGFRQVDKARVLMEKVWETKQPWEALLTTEFIG